MTHYEMVDASSTGVLNDPSAATTIPLKSPPFVSIPPSDEGGNSTHSRADSAVGLGSLVPAKFKTSNLAALSAQITGATHGTNNTREKHHHLQYRLQNAHIESARDENQTSDMVKHFIDFARVLDNRIAHLEKGSSECLPKAQTTSPDDQSNTTQVAGSPEVSETMFAPLSRKLTETDLKATEILRALCSANKSSENHILRVGCHKLASSSVTSSTSVTDGDLHPEQVEIIFISIKSRAISGFLEAQTGFKFDHDGLIHTTRPFKLLIQHAATMEGHLDKLKSKYGLVCLDDSCLNSNIDLVIALESMNQ